MRGLRRLAFAPRKRPLGRYKRAAIAGTRRPWAIATRIGQSKRANGSTRVVSGDARETRTVTSHQHGLGVYDGNVLIGRVAYDALAESFSFVYADDWRADPHAYPLSPHFPLSGNAVGHNSVRRFIENLLPEGRALDIVSVTHQVAKNNVFGLIRELGRETSGALTFLPDGTSPQAQQPARREITRAELAQRIAERAQIPFSVWDGRVRMSIAGYQDKLPVYLEDGRIFLVEGPLASTHILKLEPLEARLTLLVANEHYCASLARRLGLSVAATSILRVPEPVLVVERFDRLRTPENVRRIHIVDACQALDLPVSYKYERNFGSGRDVRHIRDGVSFEKLFSLTEYAAEKALMRQHLARWAVFQFLIGNADAHGKNVSFFSRAEGLSLAPFYDLVSVVQYRDVYHEFAMAYGDAFALEDVTPYAWADFAKRAGLARRFLAREMRRMAKLVERIALETAEAQEYQGAEREFVARIGAFAKSQAQTLLQMAGPLQSVDPKLL